MRKVNDRGVVVAPWDGAREFVIKGENLGREEVSDKNG